MTDSLSAARERIAGAYDPALLRDASRKPPGRSARADHLGRVEVSAAGRVMNWNELATTSNLPIRC